jgi:hypothetical protein
MKLDFLNTEFYYAERRYNETKESFHYEEKLSNMEKAIVSNTRDILFLYFPCSQKMCYIYVDFDKDYEEIEKYLKLELFLTPQLDFSSTKIF